MLANNNSCEPIYETKEIIYYNYEEDEEYYYNYDYYDENDEQNEQEDIPSCIKPATNLALKYGFVTDLTSLLVEEKNVYQKTKFPTLQIYPL